MQPHCNTGGLAHPASVRVTVGAEVVIEGLTRDAEIDVIRENTFPNPAFASKERMGLWTGDTDPTITTWRRTPSGLVVSRGAFPLVVGILRQHDLVHAVVDRTVAPALGLGLTLGGQLYDLQKRALGDLLRHQTGFLAAPTGSGKTNVLLSAIARLNTTTLILTHTKGLLDQTAQQCRQWLGVEPGRIGAGKWDVRPITVAMVQTLARRGCAEVAESFGAVLVDEAHHAPARTWAAVLNQLAARYKFGFTATAWRKDGMQDLMWRTIGPVTARIRAADVVAAGKILEPDIDVVETDFYFDLRDSTDWTRMLTALVHDDDRNTLIAGEVLVRMAPDTRALVLTDRVDHVYRLAELLTELDPVILTGELPKTARDAAMGRVRAGASVTIATSSLLGEGIDVPGWDLLLMASPFAGGTRTVQAVGRVCRAAPGKFSAVVVDFVDRRVPALVAAHRQRERVLAGGVAA